MRLNTEDTKTMELFGLAHKMPGAGNTEENKPVDVCAFCACLWLTGWNGNAEDVSTVEHPSYDGTDTMCAICNLPLEDHIDG